MASNIWLRSILIVRKETRCRHIGYSFRLTARVLLYAPSHRQDNTYTAFVTPVVEYWLEREIAQSVHPMKDRSDDPSHHDISKEVSIPVISTATTLVILVSTPATVSVISVISVISSISVVSVVPVPVPI